MNYKMIRYMLGQVISTEGYLMLLPSLCSLLYGEHRHFFLFLSMSFFLIAGGTYLAWKAPRNRTFYAAEGFIMVALSWVVLSALGALPFWISGQIPSFIDAFFETVSGFTTTGSSILNDVEALSHGMLFWRSFTHWIGGMGVLVFVLAVLPMSGGWAMHLMRAEAPGPEVGKLVSKLRSTAKILYGIYVVLTLIQVALLCAGGLPLFDSLLTSFGTAGTGGFGIKNSSIAFYDSAYVDMVVSVFMLLFGVNFNLFYLALAGQIGRALKSEELRAYLGIVAAATLLIAFNTLPYYKKFSTALRYSLFQVSSIITTTGFSTANYDLWPGFSQCILVLLMFIGACAGSTGGGLKISRIIILFRGAKREISRMIHPRAVSAVRFEGRVVENDTVQKVFIYFITFMALFAGSVLLVSLNEFDFTSTFTAVAACINNIGPGLNMVGATGNFSQFSVFSKLILSLDMLVGRLEIFPMLMLFSPAVWRLRKKE